MIKVESLHDVSSYKVQISEVDLAKLMYVTRIYNLEFTSLLLCDRKQGTNTFVVLCSIFPKQINTAVTSDIDGTDLMELIHKEGVDMNTLKANYHSHVNMDVYASGTDIEELKTRNPLADFVIGLIGNKQGRLFAHLIDYDKNIYLQKVPVEVTFGGKEYHEFVKEFIGECNKDKQYPIHVLDSFYNSIINSERTLLNYEEYLSNDDKELLNDIVKTRFNTLAHLSKSKIKNKNNNNHNKYRNITTTVREMVEKGEYPYSELEDHFDRIDNAKYIDGYDDEFNDIDYYNPYGSDF